MVAWGLAAFTYQVMTGMSVTGKNRPVMWGFYITSFVFWVGLSHSGTMVSAILRLSQANWRRPILRAAEAMTVFSITVAGLFPIIHLGRNWVVHYFLPYPNQRGLWPNFRSALLWDVTAITTYHHRKHALSLPGDASRPGCGTRPGERLAQKGLRSAGHGVARQRARVGQYTTRPRR